MLQGSSEPVELCDYQLVAGAVSDQERLVELGTSGELAGSSVDEDLLAAGGAQCVLLGVGVLVPSRHASVANLHQRTDPIANVRRRYIGPYTGTVTGGLQRQRVARPLPMDVRKPWLARHPSGPRCVSISEVGRIVSCRDVAAVSTIIEFVTCDHGNSPGRPAVVGLVG